MIIEHKHSQALVAALKIYRESLQDLAARVPVEDREIQAGIKTIEAAETFIAAFDRDIQERADHLDLIWRIDEILRKGDF